MRIVLYILIICVSPILFKWSIIVLLLPFQCANGFYQKDRNNNFKKVLASPYLIFERYIMRGGWQRYMLFQVSVLPSCHLRKWIYKVLGASIGPRVVFHYKTGIRMPHKLIVGGGNIIGDNALLDARNGITFGENVNLSSNVSIYTEQHDHRDPLFRNASGYDKSVRIGDRVWLGCNVIVLPGVTIGEGAVCCAGCVVTKDVEPYTVVAGIPAKKVNDRPRDLQYIFSGRSCRLY